MKFCWCPQGVSRWGSPASEADRFDNEEQVSVTLSRGFWLGQTEVTQGLWQSVMGTTPWSGGSYVKEGTAYPATYVNWDDATEFCRKLTARERAAGRLPIGWSYQLPTEAQWEYACRAGTQTAYSFGADASRLSDHGWWDGLVGGGRHATREPDAHQVGTKQANAWGLLDMHGNVWEWCQDVYGAKLKLSGGRDPPVSSGGSNRVLRGGCWVDTAWSCRSAYRGRNVPSYRDGGLGFRCALSPPGN
ncbi:MAG: formylglycine-generating enzyme family protein [Planctomycetaceae bacterium]